MRGVAKSEETKRKMSAAQEGNKHAWGLIRGPMPEEHKRKMVESKRRNAELKRSIMKKQDKTCKSSNSLNPKDVCGNFKLPLHLWPNTATAMGCIAMLNGMLKYGRSNFRAIGVRASIYQDAAKRHLDAWFEGEECDPDDGVPHLSAALACIAIIIDADAAGKLNDDRMVRGGYRKLMDKLTPHVERLKELHSKRNPKHYTIADSDAV